MRLQKDPERDPKRLGAALLAGAIAIVAGSAASAQESFAGKTIFYIVSSDAGGGYDVYTRLLARHMGRHIPGAPTTVVQNMPGGGGLRAAQYIYSVAEKDGTKIGNLRASNMLDSILGIRGEEIDPTKFNWIGNMASDTDVCSFWKTSGVNAFQDLLDKEVLVGASGKGAQNYMFASAINNVLGTKMKIVLGYKGMGDRILALERGELQGNCGMNASSLTSLQGDRLASGDLKPIMQSGARPYPALKDVPMTSSFAKTDEQRRVLAVVFNQMDIARTFALAPGTPQAIVRELRDAFDASMKDPALLADAARQKLDITPSSGAEVADAIAEMANVSPDLKQKARAAIGQ